MLALGVDPGSRATGYGLVEKGDTGLVLVDAGCITSTARAPFYERLYHIYESVKDVINRYHPDEMAIEDIFYAKNVRTSLRLGHVRGVILVAAVQYSIRIFEYTPLEIKKSVVGYGGATKEQVRSMVSIILNTDRTFSLDTSDALATVICHMNWSRF